MNKSIVIENLGEGHSHVTSVCSIGLNLAQLLLPSPASHEAGVMQLLHRPESSELGKSVSKIDRKPPIRPNIRLLRFLCDRARLVKWNWFDGFGLGARYLGASPDLEGYSVLVINVCLLMQDVHVMLANLCGSLHDRTVP